MVQGAAWLLYVSVTIRAADEPAQLLQPTSRVGYQLHGTPHSDSSFWDVNRTAVLLSALGRLTGLRFDSIMRQYVMFWLAVYRLHLQVRNVHAAKDSLIFGDKRTRGKNERGQWCCIKSAAH